jgi:hypothetical protein
MKAVTFFNNWKSLDEFIFFEFSIKIMREEYGNLTGLTVALLGFGIVIIL